MTASGETSDRPLFSLFEDMIKIDFLTFVKDVAEIGLPSPFVRGTGS
jgi:hypothetical protein